MKNSIKVRLVFFISLIIISFLIGILYSILYVDTNLIGTDLIESFKVISLNSLFLEVAFISISILFSSILIGELVYISFIFFKSFSLGIIAYSFIGVYNFLGFILIILHLLINFIYMFILFLLFIYIFNILKFVFKKYISKKEVDSNVLLKTIVKVSISFALYTSLSIILYLNNENIINIYKFILSI